MSRPLLAAFVAMALLALAGCGSATHKSAAQSMTSSYAYKYGKSLGEIAYLSIMAKHGSGAATAACQEYTEGITSGFVPAVTMVEFPQWKDSKVKSHPGWFFLGLKAGCK